jgi:hypothetical protein
VQFFLLLALLDQSLSGAIFGIHQQTPVLSKNALTINLPQWRHYVAIIT